MWGTGFTAAFGTLAVATTMAVIGASPSPAFAGGPGDPIYGDLNGDRLRDRARLAAIVTNKCVVAVELGKSGGGYQAARNYTYHTFAPGTPAYCPDLGVATDLDGDLRDELVIGWFDGHPPSFDHDVLVLKNFKPSTGFDAFLQPSFMGLADFNGDSRPDLYEWTDQGGGFATYLNTGTGTMVPGPVKWCSARPQYELADFNRDGAMDVVIAYTEGCGEYFSGVVVVLDDGTVEHVQADEFGESVWRVAVRNLNGDRYPDLVTTNLVTGEVLSHINDGDGTFTRAPRAVFDRVYVTSSAETVIRILDNDLATRQAKVTITSPPRYGTAQVTVNRTIVYTPTTPPDGAKDRFVYLLTEPDRKKSATSVSIHFR